MFLWVDLLLRKCFFTRFFFNLLYSPPCLLPFFLIVLFTVFFCCCCFALFIDALEFPTKKPFVFFFSPFLRGFFLFSLIFSLALGHSSEGHFIQYTYGFFSCVFVRLEGPGNNQPCLLSNCFFFFIRFACLHLPVYVLSINFSELLKTERFTEEDRGFINWCFFFFQNCLWGCLWTFDVILLKREEETKKQAVPHAAGHGGDHCCHDAERRGRRR